MSKKNLSVLIILLFAVLIVPFLMVSRGQTAKETPVPNPKQTPVDDELKQFKEAFPVVEYTDEPISVPARLSKSQKYGRVPLLNPNIADNARSVSILDWEIGLTALPVEKSQVIIIGKVVEATGFLSANKASVYSEFRIEVEKILKNNTLEKLDRDEYIFAERQGGVVRFPTGFEQWFFISGQRMPIVQKRYLFLLSHYFPGLAPQTKDLHILTAYELRDGVVFPLDDPSGGTHPIASYYRGKTESQLFGDLNKLLQKSSEKATKPEGLQ